MKRLVAIALVSVGLAVPGFAQRGGGARGGSVGHGGFSGGGAAVHSAPAFHSSAPAFRSGFTQPSISRALSVVPAFRGVPYRNGAGEGGRRPAYYGGDRYRRSYVPYYGFGISGWSATNYPGYYDSSLYDSPFAYGDSGYSAAPSADASQGAGYYPGGYGPPVEQAQAAAPDHSFRPVYQREQPEPAPEDAVTLVFKDGRPTEQIHNYMLTRTTLYVQDEQRREIAVADIDLTATEKVNREAGVDFRLPGSGR